jgi:uncharacterized membrane protein YgcG
LLTAGRAPPFFKKEHLAFVVQANSRTRTRVSGTGVARTGIRHAGNSRLMVGDPEFGNGGGGSGGGGP